MQKQLLVLIAAANIIHTYNPHPDTSNNRHYSGTCDDAFVLGVGTIDNPCTVAGMRFRISTTGSFRSRRIGFWAGINHGRSCSDPDFRVSGSPVKQV